MPTPYDVLPVNATGNLYNLFGFLNSNTTGGMFMPVMLWVIWIVAFIGSLSEGRQASRALIFASFIGSILSIMLAMIGMINSQWMYLMFLMVGAGVIWYQLDNAPGI